MSHDPKHELLPWFVAGTLDGKEAEEVRRHVDGCSECRDEMVVLERLREQIERHGEAFLSPHPDPERLVAAVRGDLDETEREDVLRHIALCADCATESAWVRGDAVAGFRDGGPSGRLRSRFGGVLLWRTLAAAVILLAAVLVPFLLRDGGGELEERWQYVRPVERSGDDAQGLVVGERLTRLLFEVDLPAGAFPVTWTLADASGRTVAERTGVARDDLRDGLYLSFECARADCGPGTYVATITPADGETQPLTVRFELEERSR